MWNELTNASSAVDLMRGGNVSKTAVFVVRVASLEVSKPSRAAGYVFHKSAKPVDM
jgi:hypothetical protein